MARAYSLDLRDRVVGAVLGGLSCEAAALRFGVSESSAIRWARRKRQTGSAAASKMGGKRPKLLEAERAWLMQRVAEKPDLTLVALLVELRAKDDGKDDGKGKRVCLDTLWRFLKGCGLSFKKNHLRRRTGPPRRRQTALLVAQIPGPH